MNAAPHAAVGASAPSATWRAPLATQVRDGSAARELDRISDKVLAGDRITFEEGLFLHERADIGTLGMLADAVRARKHPEGRVTYIVDRNINPTNVCITDCGFCAFYRRPNHPEAYVLERDEIVAKVQELADQGGRQVLMQGGHHNKLKSDWWCDLIADLKSRFPRINSHALSAPELHHFSVIEKRPVEDVIRDLSDAGWGSLPGAGAEMLVERVRLIIAPKKTDTDTWLDVHRKTHEAGLRSSATMMFGNVETPAERIEHLDRLRQLQDETGGFTAFACWNTQPDGVPEEHLYPQRTTPGVYLRVQAIARIYLDNFENMQTSYVTQGLKLAQVTLRYGCNDFGGTMLEENVVSAAGCFHLQSIQKIEDVIARAGFEPRRRNSWYGIDDERHDAPPSPANREEAATHRAVAGREVTR
ncbi:MAG: dehypoxanthine futalosine cyclase [Planctomycetes bacterium]|nr:dehypoxanthine futalosine cyclase [Planctomycetota bacterium]MCB9905888.1 dehypoxanthine futalosine cyclase [Planctomycetota bacterium]